MICVGIDNGVTGSIAIIEKDPTRPLGRLTYWAKNPTKKQITDDGKRNYSRIDVDKLSDMLLDFLIDETGKKLRDKVRVFIEIPYYNRKALPIAILAARSDEALRIACEYVGITDIVPVASQTWRAEFFPGNKTAKAQKENARLYALDKYPNWAIYGSNDADAVMIAAFNYRLFRKETEPVLF